MLEEVEVVYIQAVLVLLVVLAEVGKVETHQVDKEHQEHIPLAEVGVDQQEEDLL